MQIFKQISFLSSQEQRANPMIMGSYPINKITDKMNLLLARVGVELVEKEKCKESCEGDA